MTPLTILHPFDLAVVPAQSSPGAGLPNLLSQHPREAFAAASAGETVIALDLGSAQSIDTVFLGFTNLPAGAAVRLQGGENGGAPLYAGVVATSLRRSPARHALARLAAPVVVRYLRLVVTAGVPMLAGVVAVGRSIHIDSGYEQGSGRTINDTARVERLADGAFGIAGGATAGGLQWTMPALTDDERDRLYALQLDAGIGTTILVAEASEDDLNNEAMHWGLLTKLEPYARQQPGETKWSMQIQDWA